MVIHKPSPALSCHPLPYATACFIRCDTRRQKHDPPRRTSSWGDTSEKGIKGAPLQIPRHAKSSGIIASAPRRGAIRGPLPKQPTQGDGNGAPGPPCKTNTGLLKTRQTAGQHPLETLTSWWPKPAATMRSMMVSEPEGSTGPSHSAVTTGFRVASDRKGPVNIHILDESPRKTDARTNERTNARSGAPRIGQGVGVGVRAPRSRRGGGVCTRYHAWP